jgi:hypothetical protein
MEESPPAGAAPDENETTPEAGAAQEEKRRGGRWRLGVPTSVLVTFAGIALTAWLLPAFTRQWDDRQKAQELKAAIVADMASATARALVGGEAVWATPPRKVDRAQIADDWARSSLAIEARLRIYLPKRIVTAWQIYTWMVDRFAGGGRVQAEAALQSAAQSLLDLAPSDSTSEGVPTHVPTPTASTDSGHRGLDPGAVEAARKVLNWGLKKGRNAKGPTFGPFRVHSGEGTTQINTFFIVRDYVEGDRRGDGTEIAPYSVIVQSALVSFQEELTREVLAGHATGFSTSAQDLLNDLLPG